MSMVGPRPHLPREVAHYTEEQQERLAVRPGLICLREVCGRSRLSFAEWMALDLVYVQHRNLLLDAWVLLRLIPAVLRADGAY
jgi:lipopolysaccharide/colanic/teichoic acid biosynthesis glycosyltransferase